MTSQRVRFAIIDGGRKVCSAVHHADPIDTDDERRVNPGSFGDVSAFLMTFRNGLSPWKDELDLSLIDVQQVPGTSLIVVLYDGQPVIIAHASEVGNRGAIEAAERFMSKVERHVERKGPMAAPARTEKKRRVA